MPRCDEDLVIVGASARAMASSAVRAGFRVYAADLFADHDLRAIAAETMIIQPYPENVSAAIASFPPAPLLYTGALENHPALIETLTTTRPLAAVAPAELWRVRDHGCLEEALRHAGLLFPQTLREPRDVPTDGTWLVKPRASAGGRAIAAWFGVREHDETNIWQERIKGRRISVAFALSPPHHDILAVSRQLIGCRWCHASTFSYCGSIDHDIARLDPHLQEQLDRLGNVLANSFGLAGLVGADVVVDSSRQVWVIEINPRPTASMELAERATGVSLASVHLASFGVASPSSVARWPREGTWAKAILFASHDLTFGAPALDAIIGCSECWGSPDGWPAVTDVPAPPCTIPHGAPVCTVFAHERSPRAAIRLVKHRVAEVERFILR